MSPAGRRPLGIPSEDETTVAYWASAVRQDIHATIDAIATDKTRDEIVGRLLAALSSLERLDSFAAAAKGTP